MENKRNRFGVDDRLRSVQPAILQDILRNTSGKSRLIDRFGDFIISNCRRRT